MQSNLFLLEIQNTLVVNNMEEVAPLRIELYAATMHDCCSDLQTWISFIVERSNKLAFLKKEVPQDELVAIFLKGLHPVFQQLQVYFSCPGQLPETLDKAIAITRRHAASPAVAAELAKLKSSGTSHNMFPLTQQQPQKSKTICRQFARNGTCSFGARCKFTHTATPAEPGARPKCNYCSKLGHTADVCRKRLAEQPTNAALNAAIAENKADLPAESALGVPPKAANQDAKGELLFVFTVTAAPPDAQWVLDSGATCCATFAEEDCVGVCHRHRCRNFFHRQEDGHCYRQCNGRSRSHGKTFFHQHSHIC